MTKDCYGTCPKCGEMGWCHYKGKARIFKSGPGSDTYKVSIFKCGNCGKKFGFELEDSMPELRLNEEEDDSEDWEKVYDLLDTFANNVCIPDSYLYIKSAINIAARHCGRDS